MNTEAIRNIENQNPFAIKSKPITRTNAIRKPLRGVENKVARNVSVKASFKEKSKVQPAKENVKDLKPVKSLKTRIVVKKEVLHNVIELKESLPKIEETYKPKPLPEGVDNIDIEDGENPQLVSAFIKDIYVYMRKLEIVLPIKKFHLQIQTEISGKMRAVLIDWLVQVHLRFQLLQETLYMTISILDRYLQVEKVKRSELQLVGTTSMFIASKYEEMYAPDVADFVYITDNTYSKQDILRMERSMLKKLDFNLSKPLPLHFLRRNSKAGDVDATIHTLAKYLMEITLPEYDLACYQPSLLAAASLYLSLKLLTNSTWSKTLEYYSGYTEEAVLPLVKNLCKVLVKANGSKLQAVHVKYSSSKFYKISSIPQLKSSTVSDLANVK